MSKMTLTKVERRVLDQFHLNLEETRSRFLECYGIDLQPVVNNGESSEQVDFTLIEMHRFSHPHEITEKQVHDEPPVAHDIEHLEPEDLASEAATEAPEDEKPESDPAPKRQTHGKGRWKPYYSAIIAAFQRLGPCTARTLKQDPDFVAAVDPGLLHGKALSNLLQNFIDQGLLIRSHGHTLYAPTVSKENEQEPVLRPALAPDKPAQQTPKGFEWSAHEAEILASIAAKDKPCRPCEIREFLVEEEILPLQAVKGMKFNAYLGQLARTGKLHSDGGSYIVARPASAQAPRPRRKQKTTQSAPPSDPEKVLATLALCAENIGRDGDLFSAQDLEKEFYRVAKKLDIVEMPTVYAIEDFLASGKIKYITDNNKDGNHASRRFSWFDDEF